MKMNKYYETFIFKTDIESKLTASYITESINNFWNDVINNNKIFCNSNNLVQITYKIKLYKVRKRVTLLKKTIFSFEDLELFQNLVTNLFIYNEDDILRNSIVDKIVINYKILKNKNIIKTSNSNLKLSNTELPCLQIYTIGVKNFTLIII